MHTPVCGKKKKSKISENYRDIREGGN